MICRFRTSWLVQSVRGHCRGGSKCEYVLLLQGKALIPVKWVTGMNPFDLLYKWSGGWWCQQKREHLKRNRKADIVWKESIVLHSSLKGSMVVLFECQLPEALHFEPYTNKSPVNAPVWMLLWCGHKAYFFPSPGSFHRHFIGNQAKIPDIFSTCWENGQPWELKHSVTEAIPFVNCHWN